MSHPERHVQEELLNIVENAPLWPGDTISHTASYECVRRGLARRDHNDCFVPTFKGCVLAPLYWIRAAIRAAKEG